MTPETDSNMLWATLVVSALLVLTAWGNAYAMLAFALAGVVCVILYKRLNMPGIVAAAAGCILAAFVAYLLATL